MPSVSFNKEKNKNCVNMILWINIHPEEKGFSCLISIYFDYWQKHSFLK